MVCGDIFLEDVRRYREEGEAGMVAGGPIDRPGEGRQEDAGCIERSIACPGERQRALPHPLRELLRLCVIVDQPPFLRPLRAHAFG